MTALGAGVSEGKVSSRKSKCFLPSLRCFSSLFWLKVIDDDDRHSYEYYGHDLDKDSIAQESCKSASDEIKPAKLLSDREKKSQNHSKSSHQYS